MYLHCILSLSFEWHHLTSLLSSSLICAFLLTNLFSFLLSPSLHFLSDIDIFLLPSHLSLIIHLSSLSPLQLHIICSQGRQLF